MAKGVETRGLILTKSAELFNQRGYDGCSMSDITKATGLKKGGIYNHFSNKEEIAIEALKFGMDLVRMRMRKELDDISDPYQKIIAVIGVMKEFYTDPVVAGGCPIFNTAVNSGVSRPSLQKKAAEGLKRLVDYLEIKILEAMSLGVLQTIPAPRDLASLIIMTMEGGLVMSRALGNQNQIESAQAYCVKLLEAHRVDSRSSIYYE